MKSKTVTLFHCSSINNLQNIIDNGLVAEIKATTWQRGFWRTIYPGIYCGIDKEYPLDVTAKKLIDSSQILLFTIVSSLDNLYLDEDQLAFYYWFWLIAYQHLPDDKAVRDGKVKPEKLIQPMISVAESKRIKKIHKDFGEEFGFSSEQSLQIIRTVVWVNLYIKHKDHVDEFPDDLIEQFRKVFTFLIESSNPIVKTYFDKIKDPEEYMEMTSFEISINFFTFIVPHNLQFEHQSNSDSYITNLQLINYNPKSDSRIDNATDLYKNGKFTKEAYEMYDKEVGLENLRDIVDSLHECESKSEILHLIKKDPTVNDLLSGLTETESVEKLNNMVVSVEGQRSNYELQEINIDLTKYERMYNNFDEAHNRFHMRRVREYAVKLGEKYASDQLDLVYIAATLHDIGLSQDRDNHEKHGGVMIRNDEYLNSVLTDEQLEIVANAVEQHRASTGNPKTEVGKIVSDADRASNTTSFQIYRATMYHLRNYYDENADLNYYLISALNHQKEKYGSGGYGTRLYYPESKDKMDKTLEPILNSNSGEDVWEILSPSHKEKILNKYHELHD